MKGERETSTMKEGLTQKKEVERERERKRVNCSGRRRGREKAGRKKRMRQIIRIHELRFLVTYCLYLFLLNIHTKLIYTEASHFETRAFNADPVLTISIFKALMKALKGPLHQRVINQGLKLKV